MESSASTNGQAQSPWDAHTAAATANEHPELPVIGAFIGGLLLARMLKALGGEDD